MIVQTAFNHNIINSILYVQNIDEELDVAVEAFLDGEACRIDMAKREVMQNH